MKFDRLAILGVGAIGSVIGGYLTRAGHDITLIDMWADHVEAMKKDGLRITALDDDFTVPVKAMHLGEVSNVSEPFDAVFLAVKSYDTVWATHFIMRYLKPTGIIISAQNAINDEIIAPIVGYTREIGCVITLGAGLYEPGHAQRTSTPDRHSFTLGEPSGMATERVKALVEIMTAAGPAKVTSNLWGERWAKLATNSMANPVCSLTGIGSAAVRLTPETADISVKVASEVVKVGKAHGVEVEPINGIPAAKYEQAGDATVMEEIKSQLAEGAGQLGEGRPSMYQDVLKGRRTEIEFLNGYVARRGKEADVPTPVNEAITRLLKQIELGELKPDIENAKLLEQYI
jgi:2-dehydropantoate 2-reductase